ncbi:MAG: hypothetical protein RIS94_1226 [Pseudomonadota bacterium]|jgi:outer membrane receptor protein involved in Fe transport
MRRIVSALLAATAGITPAFAAEAPAAGADGTQIVVTGKGLAETPAMPAYGTRELDRERLAITASGRIEDALSAVAGFQQFRRSDSRASNPSAQGVTLRSLGGNATSRALVLLDGVPMADPFFGYIPLSTIAPERLASARVTRGGGAGAFGAGAVAGTIDLTSADADELGLINGSALVDDRGETELSGTLAPKLGQGFAVVSGRWDRGRGFWTTPVDQRGATSTRARYDSWNAGLRGVAPIAPDIELQARVAAFEDNRTLRFKGADTGMSGQDASLRLVGRGSWQFDALAYLQSRDFYSVTISAASGLPTLNQRAAPSTGAGAKLEVRPPVGTAHVLRLGADWRAAEGRTIEDLYSSGVVSSHKQAGGTNSDVGLYLEDDWTLGPVVLTGGARADRWSARNGFALLTGLDGVPTLDRSYPARSGWAGSFRGGALVHALRTLDLRAAAYSNIRQPTLNELYRSFVLGGKVPITTRANADLGNERLVGFEGGFDWRPLAGVTLSATAFDNEVRHAVANVTLSSSDTEIIRQRQNVDKVESKGVEASADVKLGTVSLGGSISYTDAKVRAPGQLYDGKRPSQTPRWAASATAAWRPKDRWTLAMTLRHVGEQFEDDLQTAALPAATTLDAFAQVPLAGPFSLILRGENLTDETVVTRNSGGTMDIGTPRTIWAGIRVEVR